MEARNHDELAAMLSAYLDGELASDEKMRVERMLDQDERARQLLEELRQTVNIVASLPKRTAPASILAASMGAPRASGRFTDTIGPDPRTPVASQDLPGSRRDDRGRGHRGPLDRQ